MITDVSLCVHGQTLRLMPERTLYWDEGRTLVAADFHWGKAATFRAAGIPLPGGGTAEDLTRLDHALARTGARRLIVLGDLFHARAGRIASQTLATLRAWRHRRSTVEMLLVRGNHDRHAGDPPADLYITCVDAPAFAPPFMLRHEAADAPDGFTLAGHVHPGITLRAPTRERARLPCFIVGPRWLILPAFGGFTGLAEVEPTPHEAVYVIAGDDVLAVS